MSYGHHEYFTCFHSDTGLPDWIRTSDPQLRRLMLYPTELRAGCEFKTCCMNDRSAPGIANRCVFGTASQHQDWSGREDSNLRPPAPKAGALPGCATPRKTPDDTGARAWRQFGGGR